MANALIKILLELRPALNGHAGIPQETRLLFRGLSLLEVFTSRACSSTASACLRPDCRQAGNGKDRYQWISS